MPGDRGGPGGARRRHGGGQTSRRNYRRRLYGLSGLTKLVVRQLPPKLDEEAFYKEASPYGMDKASWRKFIPGQEAIRPAALSTPSFAYIAFSHVNDAVKFQEGFDGHRFVNGRTGMEYLASVERAPYQVVPRPTRKRLLSHSSIIESDSDYKDFLVRYEEEKKTEKSNGGFSISYTNGLFSQPSNGTLDNESETTAETEGASVVTPLIADVRAKRRERQLRKSTVSTKGSKKRKKKKNEKVARGRTSGIRYQSVGTSVGRNSANSGHSQHTAQIASSEPPQIFSFSKYAKKYAANQKRLGQEKEGTSPPANPASPAEPSAKKRLSRNERRKLRQRQEQQRQMNNKHRARTAKVSPNNVKSRP